MRVFIAGIMQGSRLDTAIEDQGYRQVMARAVRAADPAAEVVDPNEMHPDGVGYDDLLARRTLLDLLEEAARADLLVAYVPHASMGTAVEMWQAFRAGIPIVTVSPLSANWIVRHLSAVVLPDLAAFEAWAAGGGLARLMAGGQLDKAPDVA